MKLSSIRISLMYLLYALEAGIIITQIRGMRGYTSALFTGTFLIVFILFASCFFNRIKKIDILLYFIIILAGINVMSDLWLHGGSFEFTYIKKYIMFCCTLIFLCVVSRIKPTKKLKKYIMNINTVLAIVLVLTYMTGGYELYEINGIVSSYLTFGFTNPNLTAIFCLAIAFLELFNLRDTKRKTIKLIHFILIAFLFGFIVQTQSRNCLIIFVMGVFLYCVNYLSKNNLLYSKKLVLLSVIWPLLFVVIYYFALDNIWILEKISFLDFGEGKDLASRTDIWTPAIKAIKESPWIGAYYDISNGTGESQMHNSHLDIIASYGVIVGLLVMVYLYRILMQIRSCFEGKESQAAMLGAMMILMIGMGEAAIFSGGLGIFTYLGAYLLLAKEEVK